MAIKKIIKDFEKALDKKLKQYSTGDERIAFIDGAKWMDEIARGGSKK